VQAVVQVHLFQNINCHGRNADTKTRFCISMKCREDGGMNEGMNI